MRVEFSGEILFFADEVPSIVMEIGSYCTKAGFSGDELPKVAERSVVAFEENIIDTEAQQQFYFGQDAEIPRRSSLQLKNLINDGECKDCAPLFLLFTWS